MTLYSITAEQKIIGSLIDQPITARSNGQVEIIIKSVDFATAQAV